MSNKVSFAYVNSAKCTSQPSLFPTSRYDLLLPRFLLTSASPSSALLRIFRPADRVLTLRLSLFLRLSLDRSQLHPHPHRCLQPRHAIRNRVSSSDIASLCVADSDAKLGVRFAGEQTGFCHLCPAYPPFHCFSLTDSLVAFLASRPETA